ncbi:MAG: hypothetical protein HYW48_11075 [Deltaproteobacteria bacterium]|nr:hypothetical protein [Deltaproteobacteria bacterium]
MAKKRKMGRPPAPWMYDLAMGKHLRSAETLNYEDIRTRFNVSIPAVRNFCAKLKIKGEYFFDGKNVVKRYSAKKLQQAAKEYVNLYK